MKYQFAGIRHSRYSPPSARVAFAAVGRIRGRAEAQWGLLAGGGMVLLGSEPSRDRDEPAVGTEGFLGNGRVEVHIGRGIWQTAAATPL